MEKKGLSAHHKNQGLNKNKYNKKMESKFKIWRVIKEKWKTKARNKKDSEKWGNGV